MKCHTPDCTGEHETREISHSVVYRERTYVIRHVPAAVCPECGDAVLAEETALYLDALLQRKARGKRHSFAYEAGQDRLLRSSRASVKYRVMHEGRRSSY